MKVLLGLLLFTSSSLLFSQTEKVTRLDSTIGTFGTTYLLVVGELTDGKKTGEWSLYQYSARDTSKILAATETYDADRLKSRTEHRLDGYTEQVFGKSGWIIKESNYRYGNLTWQKEYQNRKKIISRTYYPNGQISGEGPEVLVKIIAGCDSGMMNFQRLGEWIYYDTDGEEIDRQVYTLNKEVFKKV